MKGFFLKMRLIQSLFFSVIMFIVISAIAAVPEFTENEIRLIKTLSSQQYDVNKTDHSNHVSGNKAAIAFGKKLFFSKQLSGDQMLSCASCHNPAMGWCNHDVITQKRSQYPAQRHTPSLLGVKYNRWFFWDGRADSLWSQALQPLENPVEMATSRVQLAQLILRTPTLRHDYETVFGEIPILLRQATLPKTGRPVSNNPNHPDQLRWQKLTLDVQQAINRLYVNIGKSLAAFEETLVSKHTPFDQFVATLTTQQPTLSVTPSTTMTTPTPTVFPLAAKRGLKLFIGKAGCINCHFSAHFSDGEFHHSFLKPFSLQDDLGRYDGIKQLLANPFNGKGVFSDFSKKTLNKLDFVYQNSLFRAQFKTPSLRNVAITYPYMHTGQFKTLKEVVHHYNTIDEHIAPNSHQEVVLRSLSLSDEEEDDLVAFLHSLTEIKTYVKEFDNGD